MTEVSTSTGTGAPSWHDTARSAVVRVISIDRPGRDRGESTTMAALAGPHLEFDTLESRG